MADAVPSEFLCPITYEVMTDPVILSDGHTYERTAIEEWLRNHNTSPLSNRRVSLADAKPNYTLRAAIERWQGASQTQKTPAQTATQQPLKRTFKARTDGKNLFLESEDDLLDTATILVNDVSGSMDSPSANPYGGGAKEGAVFSRLDLVKHSNRTIAHLIAQRNGSLGIITFSDTSSVVLPIRTMDATGLAEAERVISGLRVQGGTNMWAGIQLALRQASAFGQKNPNTHINIVFLTDGEPTADYLPLRGLVPTFEANLARLKIPVTLHAFGFGYQLDTKLLEGLSKRGGGIYGYLPDCSMVGSVSINAVATTLSLVASDVSVGSVRVGNLQRGVPRIVPLGGLVAGQEVKVTWQNGGTANIVLESAGVEESDSATAINKVLQVLQEVSVDRVWSAERITKIEEFLTWMGEDEGLNRFLTALRQDMKHPDEHKGQILKALKTAEWFGSWGLNHLVSYARALELQQCVNFKDQAVQFFAGDTFRSLQDRGNEIFDGLEPPQPSCAGWSGSGGPAPSMGTLNNAGGGCWAGWCKVLMESGWVPTHQLKAGDVVYGGHRILCVVRTKMRGPVPMVHIERKRLSITPWHPVRAETGGEPGEWVFPCANNQPVEEFNHYVYNLVLESGHTVNIGSYKVCTLAHYFTENDVIRHEYYGTRRILDDLAQLPGWKEGLITLTPEQIRRGDNGDVARIHPLS